MDYIAIVFSNSFIKLFSCGLLLTVVLFGLPLAVKDPGIPFLLILDTFG